MSAIEVTGKVLKVFETKQITEKFSKRELVVEIPDDKYPQPVLFQLTGGRCGSAPNVGEEIKLEFNLRGREWKSPKDGEIKYFNSLDVWRFKVLTAAPAQVANAPQSDDPIPF